MDERIKRVSELLQEAAELHHQVYRIVDGDDEDWALWYADWLTRLSELPDVIGANPAKSEVMYLLMVLAKEYEEQERAEKWEDYYAAGLVERLGGE